MPNITLSIEEHLLEAGRQYAQAHGTSLNGLIRDLLANTVTRKSDTRLEDMWRKVDKLKISSQGKKWKREDLYDE